MRVLILGVRSFLIAPKRTVPFLKLGGLTKLLQIGESLVQFLHEYVEKSLRACCGVKCLCCFQWVDLPAPMGAAGFRIFEIFSVSQGKLSQSFESISSDSEPNYISVCHLFLCLTGNHEIQIKSRQPRFPHSPDDFLFLKNVNKAFCR